MKKWIIFIVLSATMMLSACSVLEEVNTSLDYVNTATEHINELNTFAEEAPQLIDNAINDPKVAEKLEMQISTLKQDVEDFIATTEVPAVAEEIHQDLVNKHEILLKEIDKVLEDGNLALDKLEDSQLFTTIEEATNLINRIENLTQ